MIETTTAIDLNAATVAEIRDLLRASQQDLADARSDEEGATVTADYARQAKAIDGSKTNRDALTHAQRQLAVAMDRRLDTEARVKALERGLATAQAGAKARDVARWQSISAEQRELVAADRAESVEVLMGCIEALDDLEAHLDERRRVLDALAKEAAAVGCSMPVSPAPLLSSEYRVHRNVRELLEHLAKIRRI